MRRRSTDFVPSKRQAVVFGAFSTVLAALSVLALDQWDDGMSWGAAVRSEIFYMMFMFVWMSVFWYYGYRWLAERKRS